MISNQTTLDSLYYNQDKHYLHKNTSFKQRVKSRTKRSSMSGFRSRSSGGFGK